MAIVYRLFRAGPPANEDLQREVAASAAVEPMTGLYQKVVANPKTVITFDDAVPGVEATLLGFMQSRGWEIVGDAAMPDVIPAVQISDDPTTGLFGSAGLFYFEIAGLDRPAQFDAQGVGIANGAVATPSLYFQSEPDTGIYSPGANSLSIAAGGAEAIRAQQAGGGPQALFPDGATNANPGISFLLDQDTGICRVAANTLGITCGATVVMRIVSTQIRSNINGTAGIPFYSFNNDTDTGIFLPAAGSLGFAVDAVERMRLDNSAVANDTAMLISVAGAAAKRVTQGAADSGGAGFRVLRVAN